MFVDILPETFNMDPAAVSAAITPKTKAIIAVHLFGQPADMNAIVQIAKAHNLVVIEDAAQAIDAAYHGRPLCSWGRHRKAYHPIVEHESQSKHDSFESN